MAETGSTAPAGAQTDAATLRASVSKRRLIFVVVGTLLGMMLGALDQTVVTTALPTITKDLNGTSQYSLVVTAYLLASTVAVPIYGKLSDIYGRRIFFLGGMIIFLLGSALSGTSQDITQLILYRALQGLGAGSLMPIAQAIIGDIFPPAERGKWQGLMVSVFGLATILGPLAGGWITDQWSWRWVFYINMPVGALAILTAGIAMPQISARHAHKIDYLGSVALILAAVPLLIGFTLPTPGMTIEGQHYDFGSPQVLGLLGFAALMWIIFFVIETRAAEPIISPRLFKSNIFTVSVIATFMLAAGMFGAILYLPFFVQDVLLETATNSGVVLMPMMLGFMVSSIVGGQILARTGRYKVLALTSFALGIVGMLLFAGMGIETSQQDLIRNMVITGLGLGALMSLFTIVVQNAFPFRQLGEVTAGLTFFRSIGSTIGVAIMGVIQVNALTSALTTNLAPVVANVRSQPLQIQLAVASAVSGSGPGGLNLATLQAKLADFGWVGQLLVEQFKVAMQTSWADSIHLIFLLGAGIMVLGFLATVCIKEIPLRSAHSVEAEAVGPEGVEAPIEVASVLG